MNFFAKTLSKCLFVSSILILTFSCSKNDSSGEDRPVPAEYQIEVTTGAAAVENETRAVIEISGSDYAVKYATGDELLVWGTDASGKYFYGALPLSSGAGTTSASFSGTLNVESGSSMTRLQDANTINALLAPSNWSSYGFSFVESTHSYQHTTFTPVSTFKALENYLHIASTNYDKSTNKFTLDNAYSILHVKCRGLAASTSYTINAYNQQATDGRVNYCGKTYSSDANGFMEFYLPLTLTHAYYFSLTDGTNTFEVNRTTKTTENYKVYNFSFTFLAGLSSQYTIQDNAERLIGENSYGIIIPDGYNIALDNVIVAQNAERTYSPIVCAGNATIRQIGTCEISTSKEGYPAILVGGSDKTLTISGSGTLKASGAFNSPAIGCMNGGTCGNISISGGTVWAQGGTNAPAIGTGYTGTCGTIKITSGATKVTAIRGTNQDADADYIGKSSVGTCGDIIIDGEKNPNLVYVTSSTNFNWSCVDGYTWELTKK